LKQIRLSGAPVQNFEKGYEQLVMAKRAITSKEKTGEKGCVQKEEISFH